MNFAAFPATDLGAPPPAAALAAAAAGSSKHLAFTVTPQEQDQWCWAAVSSSVSLFFNAASPWTQCQVATDELQFACCGADATGPCNRWWYLNRALTRTGNLLDFTQGAMSGDEVLAAVEADAPLGVRVEWSDQSGHFICISGIDLGGAEPMVTVTDPIYGGSVLPISALTDAYQQSGRWTHSYTTQA